MMIIPNQSFMHKLSNRTFSRRGFVITIVRTSALMLPAATVLSACGKKTEEEKEDITVPAVTDCSDLTGVSKEDIAIRAKLAYVNESPVPESECADCNLYLPPGKEKKCGGCMLFKGPVEPKGYCTYWAPKVES